MELNEIQFKETIYNTGSRKTICRKPVLVDLYTDWCTACKIMSPALDSLEAEMSDVDIIKVNVSTADELVNDLGVSGVPTLLYISPEKGIVNMTVGAIPPAAIKENIVKFLTA